MSSVTIGVIGTAKNTGKTTTAIEIMKEALESKLPLAVTGIGYDGEEIDNVTFLPKPRYNIHKRVIIATAEECGKTANAKLEILKKTDIDTTLGKVTIYRVKEAGTIVLAGPNTGRGVSSVTRVLRNMGAKLVIVDGSINRIAPMAVVNGLVLSTGAAREADIRKLALDTSNIVSVFDLPMVCNNSAAECTTITLFQENGRKLELPFGSLLTVVDSEGVAEKCDKKTKTIVIPGVAEAESLMHLVKTLGNDVCRKTIVFHDPTKLLVNDCHDIIADCISKIKSHGGEAAYAKALRLFAITINPFYPRYSNVYQDYEPAYVDRDELLEKISQASSVPVIDVLRGNGRKIIDIVYRRK